MTKIEEIEQKLNECQKALAELKESKKEGKWKPNYGDYYWWRDTWGEFKTAQFTNKETLQWRYNNIPMFPTKEICEKYWHFMDTVKEKSYEFSKEEWDNVTLEKYHIVCDYGYSVKKFIIQMNYQYKVLGTIYFKTEEDAQYIIDNFKDELMEYWI